MTESKITLTFEEFRASKRESSDLGRDVGFDYGDGITLAGFVYADGCYIEHNRADSPEPGAYYLLIERSDWISDDLAKLERILWALHYLENCDQPVMLSQTDATLDDYIRGQCDARGVPVDGDLFGAIFSGKEQWSLEEAQRKIWREGFGIK